MKEILSAPWFLYLIVPLVTVFLVVFFKLVSRNDKHASLVKEDFAVGLDISITALIVFITDLTCPPKTVPV